ncbi:hypothetical protein H4217_001579 [Coemansia sp. RSA 1939]|nr:hypothetical protein H4217_001579 [Coemansia sp. RSA 1939]
MSIPLSRYNRSMANRTENYDDDDEERYRTLTPALTDYSVASGKADNESMYYYEHQWKNTMGNGKTFVGDADTMRSMGDSMMPSHYIMPERTTFSRATGKYQAPSTVEESSSSSTIALVPKKEESLFSDSMVNLEPLGGRLRQAFVGLRLTHTMASVFLVSCLVAMQVYMLMVTKVTMVAVPHFVCRVILMAVSVILVLCDWAKPRSILKHFPMYNDKRSWKGLGLTQVVVALFVLGDSTLADMQAAENDRRFAKVLFPLVVSSSSLMLAVGIAYFVAGAIGGVKIKQRFKQ